jgi:D-glycero-D-manno-heptose 1,7-bisphosphate phosphatase
MTKALFLDRDGTLIHDRHYLFDPAGVELVPGAAGALRRAQSFGYRLFLHTNQAGIARGLYTLDDVLRCNDRMEELLGLPRPVFADVCIAPEGSDDPNGYRKPSPRYLLETIGRHALDPRACWMVGDRESDIEAGRRAGIASAGVCTGKLDAAGWSAAGFRDLPIFRSIVEFVDSLAPASGPPHA